MSEPEPDYAAAVRRARLAALGLYRVDGERACLYDERDRALAAAWDSRPGGVTWLDLTAAVCSGLPKAARFTWHTARTAVRGVRQSADVTLAGEKP